MKSIKESAEEYAGYPGVEYVTEMMHVRRTAYLAGAKYALEMAKAKFTEYGFDQIEQEDAASILQNLIPE